MSKNNRRGIVGESLFDNLAWIDIGTIDRASEQFPKRNDPVTVVEHQAGEDLMMVVTKTCTQIISSLFRTGQAILVFQLLCVMAPGYFEGCL